MNSENTTKLLANGEQILWASMSQPGKLMDKKNKVCNLTWFICVGVAFALLMYFYSKACIRAGTSVFTVVTYIFILMAAIIFLDPITTFSKLKKVEYTITTQRVIVCSSTAASFSIPLSKATPVQVIEEDDGTSTLIIGTDHKVKPTKMRLTGLMGLFVNVDGKDIPHPVFYHVPDAKDAVRILESAKI